MNAIQLYDEFTKSSKLQSEDLCLQTVKNGISQSFIRVTKVLVESPFLSLASPISGTVKFSVKHLY